MILNVLFATALAIQDNSFLVEEAYNQDPRVVQHITQMVRDGDGRWTGTFTQEWPAGGLAHQLSVTLPLDQRSDALLNYRYQWIGNAESRLACSPRLSLLAGSRDDPALGLQALVPVSIALGDRAATHWNAGLTRVRGATTWNGGASVIWAAREKVHLMLESVWDSDSRALTVSPGVRWAYDFKSGLQIVPGVAVPVDTRAKTASVLLYLSFEHPF